MPEYEASDLEEAKKKAARDATRNKIKERLEDLYNVMFINCQKGDRGRCHRAPALICVNSLTKYPDIHCWLQEKEFFPLLADGAFYTQSTDGTQPYDTLVRDKAPFGDCIKRLKGVLK